ncbi:hypothetical protein NE237_028103 [Protea cynaroides]|uniref:Uncharacterized protein n=1 Tax=Protea cynaroides TaxID=273540 RepID=A0A9Q0JTL4_9MAGN|nr:hypothetical protein NE237_028103 [Protea cynaroides]
MDVSFSLSLSSLLSPSLELPVMDGSDTPTSPPLPPRTSHNPLPFRKDCWSSKAKINFPLTSEINNNTNNQQSPNQSSTVESSSREGFSLAPPLVLDLCGGSGGGSCVGSSGGFTMRSSFHHHPHPHHQQFRVLPTVHPFFFFDPFVSSENKNMNHHHLSFDPVVPATADFQAAFAGGVNGAQSDSDSSTIVDISNYTNNPLNPRRLLDIDLNQPHHPPI